MEGQGEGRCRAGGELEIIFIADGEGIGCLSLINVHSFIAEVKLKRRWKPGWRGGCLTSPRKLHGKNISKHTSVDLSWDSLILHEP